METSLKGLRAVVCGSTQGIGKATAMALAAEGASVTLLARDAEKLNRVLAELGSGHSLLVADMADTVSLARAIADHVAVSPVDLLVNNTGGPAPGPAHEADVTAYADAFRLHLLSYQTLVRAVVPGMKERQFGRIVNVISTSVKLPLPNLGVSNTIRGAVANWGKTLANELGPFGITVNNVLPGATETERLATIIRNKAQKAGISEAEVIAEMVYEIPLRRFARPQEIAAAVAFLCGPSGAYINGINLPVDGGRTGNL